MPAVINSIEDLRGIARRRIPRALFDYIDRGSYDERTWARNRDDLRAIELRQRVARASLLEEHLPSQRV